MNLSTQKYIGYAILVFVIVGGVFLLKYKKANAPIDNGPIVETPDPVVPTPEPVNPGTPPPAPITPPSTPSTPDALTVEQKALLAKLEKKVNARDFEAFALILEEVYKKEWDGVKEFMALESKLYVYATNEYWVKGDLANSLKVSTIVYTKVPEAWRFRYLRIVTLHKYGRNAFESGDLVTAEGYAMQILQMMYRPEGANLLADIFITRIKASIASGNTSAAKQDLNYIWDFEVNADRRATLTELKKQLGV